MTETGTQTWHELAETVEDYREAIDSVVSAYERGVQIHKIMERLKALQESDVRSFGWNPYRDSPRDAGRELWLRDMLSAEHGEPDPLADDPAAHYQGHQYKGVKLDPYRIAQVYELHGGPREQILKKCLRFTSKGQSEQEVINEIRSALDRWQEMVEEDHD